MVIVSEAEGAVYSVEQLLDVDPAVRLHELLLNVPPAPPSLHATVPVGADWAPGLISAIVALKVTDPPTFTLIGFGLTEVLVPRREAVKATESALVE